jgi:hypothetical protein
MRVPILAVLGLGVAALLAYNVASLASETGALVWVAALGAAVAGAALWLVLAARPPAIVERLTGPRRGLLPILAAGVAVLVVGSAPPEGQLVALAFFAGLLLPPIGGWALRRAR